MNEQRESSGGDLNGREMYVTHRWSRAVFQPGLITLMVTSLFTGIIAISWALPTNAPWMSLLVLFIFVSLEGIYTGEWLEHPDRRTVDRLTYRAAELLVITVIVRLFTWATSGNWPQFRLIRNYMLSPLALIDDGFFIVSLILTLLAWGRALSLRTLFSQLTIDQAEVGYYSLPRGQREPGNRPMGVDRSYLAARYFQQWIGGATVLAISAAVTTLDFSGFSYVRGFEAVQRNPLRPEMLALLVIYFLSGLLLMSQARLAAMNARWLIAGMTKSRGVEARWRRMSLWLLGLVALIAAIVPLGPTLDVSGVLLAILRGILSLFRFITAIFVVILSLLFPGRAALGNLGANRLSQPPPFQAQPTESSELLAMIVSSIFWALIVFAVVTGFRLFLKDRGLSLNKRLVHAAWRAMLAWMREVWHGFFDQVTTVREAVRRVKPSDFLSAGQMPRIPWRFRRIGALSPRDQIRYYYLAIVKRAGGKGVSRLQSETPREYAQDLKEIWPETMDQVDGLTESFIKARYSQESILPEDVVPVKEDWRRLRTILRRQRAIQKRGHQKNDE